MSVLDRGNQIMESEGRKEGEMSGGLHGFSPDLQRVPQLPSTELVDNPPQLKWVVLARVCGSRQARWTGNGPAHETDGFPDALLNARRPEPVAGSAPDHMA